MIDNDRLKDFTIDAKFVPASQVTRDDWKNSINFNVHVKYRGTTIYNGHYGYGIGRLPGYNHSRAAKLRLAPYIETAKETGQWPKQGQSRLAPVPRPDLKDVLYCLLLDASTIDYASFEDWADDVGCNKDSRKDEKIYQECLAVGLRMRVVLGDQLITELREMFQDY
jgi:hypothetical protein